MQPLAGETDVDWDDGNAPKMVDRHGVEPGECEQAFFREPFVVSYDAGTRRGRRPQPARERLLRDSKPEFREPAEVCHVGRGDLRARSNGNRGDDTIRK